MRVKLYRIERKRQEKWVGIYQQKWADERGFELARLCGHDAEVKRERYIPGNEDASRVGNRIYQDAFMWHEVTYKEGVHWYTPEGFKQFSKMRNINGKTWDCLSLIYALCADPLQAQEDFRIVECLDDLEEDVIYQDDMQIVFHPEKVVAYKVA